MITIFYLEQTNNGFCFLMFFNGKNLIDVALFFVRLKRPPDSPPGNSCFGSHIYIYRVALVWLHFQQILGSLTVTIVEATKSNQLKEK